MTNTNTSLSPAAAILWASAFLLFALIIVQAGSLPGSSAFAEMADSGGDYAALTTTIGKGGGGGDEPPYQVLYVVDSREEVLMVFEIEDARSKNIILRGGGSLSNLFRGARP